MDKCREEIGISGMSGRFPECGNLEDFRKKLYDGADMITSDFCRWPDATDDLHNFGGKIPNIERFDANFFAINSTVANKMDPQMRIFHEVVYESIIDAGYNPGELRGRSIGVFVGIYNSDAWYSLLDPGNATSGYEHTGCLLSMVANRISYAFDFRGPSVAIDTACSSSMMAFYTAVKAIQAGECEAAIVGGLNIVLAPHLSVQYSKFGMLSDSCRSFDDSVTGFVRSECISALFLQNTNDARRIYSTVLGAATNTDGYKEEGLTHPSRVAQRNLLEAVYEEAGINPDEVGYLEAHGTGTPAGDPQEVNGIADFFCGKKGKLPLLLGSVKSNAGHSESSSGVMSVVKALFAFESGVIPGNIKFCRPNRNIPSLLNGQIEVVTKNTALPNNIIGINNLGLGGTNVHAILRANIKEKTPGVPDILPRLVVVSGRTKEAVAHLLDAADCHKHDHEFLALLNAVHEKNINRHNFRGFTILQHCKTSEVKQVANKKRPLWFVYSGMGSQLPHMGKELMKIDVFRDSIEQWTVALKPVGVDLKRVITEASQKEVDILTNCFSSIIAMEVALTDLLCYLGIIPDGIIGHSLGETGCAYADGTLTRKEAVLTGYFRGKATLDSSLIPGLMCSVGLSWKECVKQCPPDIFPVCNNAQDNVTISGPKESVEKFVQVLEEKKIFCRIVNTAGVAFHSKYINDVVPKISNSLRQIIKNPKKRSSKWISTSIPEISWMSPLALRSSAEYHVNNYTSSVYFYEALKEIPENAVVIEVGPTSLMQAILKRALPKTVTNVPITDRDGTMLYNFMKNLGRIYNLGYQPNIAKLYEPVKFPVSKSTPMISPFVKWDHSVKWHVPVSNGRNIQVGEKFLINALDGFYSTEYCLNETEYFPVSGYLILIWKAIAKKLREDYTKVPIILNDITFYRNLDCPIKSDTELFVHVSKKFEFKVFFKDTLLCSGLYYVSQDIFVDKNNFENFLEEQDLPLTNTEIYHYFSNRGYYFGDTFKGIKEISKCGQKSLVNWTNNWMVFMDCMLQIGIFNEQCDDIIQPTYIEKLIIDPRMATANNSSFLPVRFNNNLIKSVAIEIYSPKYELAYISNRTAGPHRKSRILFVPNDIETGTFCNITHRDVLELVLQLVIENCGFNINIVEFTNDSKELLIQGFKDAVKSERKVVAKYTVMVKNSHSDATKITEEDIEINEVVQTSKPKKNAYDLLIVNNILKMGHTDIAEFVPMLKTGGFLLLTGHVKHKNKIWALENSSFVAVTKHFAGNTVFVTFRALIEIPKTIQVINTSDEDTSWFGKLETISTDSDKRIYVVCNSTALQNVLCFLNSTKTEMERSDIRFFIMFHNNNVAFTTDNPKYARQVGLDLKINIFKNGKWGSYRTFTLDKAPLRKVQDAALERNFKNNYCWNQINSFNLNNNAVNIYYTSIHESNTSKHIQFSGCDSNGKRMIGITKNSSIASSAIIKENFSWKINKKWSFVEAATVPLPYFLAYYAFSKVLHLGCSSCVLIKTGLDISSLAVALVSIQKQFKTIVVCDSKETKNVFQKRLLHVSENIIYEQSNYKLRKIISKLTNGQGVDLVLNFSSNNDIPNLVLSVKKCGYFLQMTSNVNDSLPYLEIITKQRIFFANIDIEDATDDEVKYVSQCLKDGIQDGAVKPLPYYLFNRDEIDKALSFAQKNSTHKILLKIHKDAESDKCVLANPRTYLDQSKAYLIVDTADDFSFELANWLIKRGAKKLVISSKLGLSYGYRKFFVEKWRKMGIEYVVSDSIINDKKELKIFLEKAIDKLGTVGGIFYLTFNDLVVTDLQKTLTTAKSLDMLSRILCPHLDYFVILTNISSIYKISRVALNDICEERVRLHFPSKIIEFGAIKRADNDKNQKCYAENTGTHPQSVSSVLDTLDEFLQRPEAHLCSYLVAEKENKLSEHSRCFTDIQKTVADILGIEDLSTADQNATFLDFGIDSLMATEIVQRLWDKYQVKLAIKDIRHYTLLRLKDLRNNSK